MSKIGIWFDIFLFFLYFLFLIKLKTTKKSKDAHGFGTKIIAKIAADYHGMVDYFEDFNMFGVQVVLPELPERKDL